MVFLWGFFGGGTFHLRKYCLRFLSHAPLTIWEDRQGHAYIKLSHTPVQRQLLYFELGNDGADDVRKVVGLKLDYFDLRQR